MKRYMILLALLALAACDRGEQGMETRSYQLARLQGPEAVSLITPYVREGGRLSATKDIVTVREKPDRLTVIEDLLKKFDGGGEANDVVMKMQVIEANGFTERDARIADIEATLRETFKYGGYRLVGETQIRTREDSNYAQSVENMEIRGRVYRLSGNRIPIDVMLRTAKSELGSTITAEMGKPVVLGQSVGSGAMILVIRTSLAGT